MCLANQKTNQRIYYEIPNSAFWGWLSMESQPQNPEFRITPENFHPCIYSLSDVLINYTRAPSSNLPIKILEPLFHQ